MIFNAIDEIKSLLDSIKGNEDLVKNIHDRLEYIEDKANIIKTMVDAGDLNDELLEKCESIPDIIVNFDWSRVDINIVNNYKMEEFLETLKNT